MPNPFDNAAPSNAVNVTDSELWCDKCWELTSEGLYFSESHKLTWVCPNGHNNELEIDLD